MTEIICCLDSSINTKDEIISFIRENELKIPSSIMERFKNNLIVTICYEKESKNFYGWSGYSYNHIIKEIYIGNRQFELIIIPKTTEIWYD